MYRTAIGPLGVLFLVLGGCNPGADPAPPSESDLAAAAAATLAHDAPAFRYVGRVDPGTPAGATALVGAASYVEFEFRGDTLYLGLGAAEKFGGYTWAIVELDGAYAGRHRIERSRDRPLALASPRPREWVRARVHHGAEPLFSHLAFRGARADSLRAPRERPARTVAFFGDSMSSGAASDTTAGPCGREHANANAYLAFPARVGRAVGADYVVHSASGRGLYTNWNGQEPPLPALLPHLYLDTASAKTYDMAADPLDAAVVVLGANDVNHAPELRPAFDSARFERAYLTFVAGLAADYPTLRLLLVDSPMHGGDTGALLGRIIERVAQQARRAHPGMEIATHRVPAEPLHGCPAGPHPSVDDHARIAEGIVGKLRALLAG